MTRVLLTFFIFFHGGKYFPLKYPSSSMEDERLFYIFWFLPWKTGVFSLFNLFPPWWKPRAPLVSLFRWGAGAVIISSSSPSSGRCSRGWGNAPCRLFLSRVHFLTWCWWFCWGLQAWINIDDLRKCHIKTDITCSVWANVPTNDGEASTINVSVLGLRLFSSGCRKTARQGFLCATKQRS